MRVSVVLPAKNESGAIEQTISKILNLKLVDEVLVVNDGSTDNTAELAERAGAKVVSHPYSKGNGAAIKTGARNALGDIIVFMDADGQHDPADIPKLLEKINSGYDLVVGARQKGSQASLGRGIANKLYNNLASYMTEHKVEDLTSGFRAARADKFREFIYLLPNGFSYPTTSTMAFFRAGYSICYIPIHARQRIGKSHIQPLRDGIRFFLIIFKIATLYSPLKMFLPLAVLLFLMGSGWYGYTLYEYHRFTNMSALFYTGSITIFLMGLISEQITALMYKES
ncbi:glycosyltransferase family 2 protein [Acinetobacter portensis]|uniref:Glycosyltransferase family 2 protein n=1 Tax=Acinetobacter portensis TaxID=1839785 RepID=A0ABY4JYM6_9GAMM|nr:glycosyltransferase family 2 protein [Acinetobacter portensis]MCK7607971.1 glycosyltransferase family 2 protein [Acinetobacter portensis]MCK7638732.1 glycosyltransferase family 2 protein [Acinetobacter portensis]UPO23493.1 glycosyltransferase family 2 protein [Acinetobacter portensis]